MEAAGSIRPDVLAFHSLYHGTRGEGKEQSRGRNRMREIKTGKRIKEKNKDKRGKKKGGGKESWMYKKAGSCCNAGPNHGRLQNHLSHRSLSV